MLDETNFPLRLLFSLLFCIYANLTEERNCFDFFLDLEVVFNPVMKFKIMWKKSRETATLLLFKRNEGMGGYEGKEDFSFYMMTLKQV